MIQYAMTTYWRRANGVSQLRAIPTTKHRFFFIRELFRRPSLEACVNRDTKTCTYASATSMQGSLYYLGQMLDPWSPSRILSLPSNTLQRLFICTAQPLPLVKAMISLILILHRKGAGIDIDHIFGRVR